MTDAAERPQAALGLPDVDPRPRDDVGRFASPYLQRRVRSTRADDGRPKGRAMPGSDYSRKRDDEYGAALAGTAAMLMGLLVVVLGTVAILMWSRRPPCAGRRESRRDDGRVLGDARHGHDCKRAAGTLTSYAGAAPANADVLAAAHKPYPAALPPAQAGPVADVNLALTDINVQIAPGVKLRGVGVGRRSSRPGHPRPPGPDGQDHADQQRCDPTFRRLPRRSHRPRQGVHGRVPRASP